MLLPRRNSKTTTIYKVGSEIEHQRIYNFSGRCGYRKRSYVVALPKSAKYAAIQKNSVTFKEVANERIFLMKDMAAVEEAVVLGAKIYEGMVFF